MAPPDSQALPIERLLAEHDWVHRIAHSLVADPAGADDLEQDTWLAAVARPPARTDAPRAWLGTVLRRRLANLVRSRGRRARHEAAAARAESIPSAADLAARAEVHERLARAVLALAEPYRTTVLHRFLDDAPPREVARRMDVPVETVRTRTRRAIVALRADLDPKEPDRRRAIGLAVWTLAGRSPRAAAPASDRAASTAVPGWALAGMALLLAGAGAWVFAVSRDGGGRAHVAPETRDVGALAAPPAAPARHGATGASTRPVPMSNVRLDVRDAITGRPVAGAIARDVSFGAPDAVADANGRLDLSVTSGGRHVVAVWAAGYVGTWRAHVDPIPREAQSVFLYPIAAGPGTRRLAGRVEDGTGAPVADALVRGVDRFGRVLVARTDASGAFGVSVPWNGIAGVLLADPTGAGAGAAAVSSEPRSGEWDAVPRFTTIRLADRVEVRIRIAGDGAPGLEAFVRIRPATRWLAGDAARHVPAVDGMRLSLAPGAWRLSLTTPQGEELTPEAFVLATAGGVLSLSFVPDRDSEDGVLLSAGDALDVVTFDVEARSLRVSVLEGERPVEGAVVTLEPTDASDPFVFRYGEYGPSHPSRRSGLSGFLEPGRRAPLHRTRTATTGEDGVARVRGWIPPSGRLRVRGAGIADTFRDLTEAEAAAGSAEVGVERGGVVDVAWPSWLRVAVLERVDGSRAGEAFQTSEARGSATVPPGRYVLRWREISWIGRGKAAPSDGGAGSDALGPPPERDPIVVLHGPFEVRAGERTFVDMRSCASPRRTTLLLDVPGVSWVTAVPIWGPPDVRPLEEGRVSFPTPVRSSKTRYGFAWAEAGGPTPATHFHEIDVSTEADAGQDGEHRFDARYEGFARRLHVLNHEDVPVLLSAGVGREGDAPHLDQHRVTFLVPGGSAVDVVLSHLPRGSWWLASLGPGFASVWPGRFEVDGTDTSTVAVEVRDEHVVVRVLDADGQVVQGLGRFLDLRPVDPRLGENQTAPLGPTGGWFPRVPAGRWHLTVLDFAVSDTRPDRGRLEPSFETDLVVEPGQHEASVTWPRR